MRRGEEQGGGWGPHEMCWGKVMVVISGNGTTDGLLLSFAWSLFVVLPGIDHGSPRKLIAFNGGVNGV